MNITVAMAVSHENKFVENHFGDADKYLIYQLNENACTLLSEQMNVHKEEDAYAKHGSRKKGESIVAMLKKQNVKVLISRQFGPNIKIIAKHFVPVIVTKESPNEACETLVRNHRWIYDELDTEKDMYAKFIMGKGALKTSINTKF